jgi:ADP-ribose pyrophosphatase YjhB (NUDIX family)
MTPKIRLKALGVFKHENRFLFSKHYDATHQDYFVRPLGGTVEFGEQSKDTLHREIQEEINAAITEVQLLQVIEDMFEHHGKPFHDVVFLYQARFVDEAIYQQSQITCEESDGIVYEAYWLSLEEIKEKQYRIVPQGLEAILAIL